MSPEIFDYEREQKRHLLIAQDGLTFDVRYVDEILHYYGQNELRILDEVPEKPNPVQAISIDVINSRNIYTSTNNVYDGIIQIDQLCFEPDEVADNFEAALTDTEGGKVIDDTDFVVVRSRTKPNSFEVNPKSIDQRFYISTGQSRDGETIIRISNNNQGQSTTGERIPEPRQALEDYLRIFMFCLTKFSGKNSAYANILKSVQHAAYRLNDPALDEESVHLESKRSDASDNQPGTNDPRREVIFKHGLILASLASARRPSFGTIAQAVTSAPKKSMTSEEIFREASNKVALIEEYGDFKGISEIEGLSGLARSGLMQIVEEMLDPEIRKSVARDVNIVGDDKETIDLVVGSLANSIGYRVVERTAVELLKDLEFKEPIEGSGIPASFFSAEDGRPILLHVHSFDEIERVDVGESEIDPSDILAAFMEHAQEEDPNIFLVSSGTLKDRIHKIRYFSVNEVYLNNPTGSNQTRRLCAEVLAELMVEDYISNKPAGLSFDAENIFTFASTLRGYRASDIRKILRIAKLIAVKDYSGGSRSTAKITLPDVGDAIGQYEA